MNMGPFSSLSHPWTLQPIAKAGLINSGVKPKRTMPIAIREVPNWFGPVFGTFRRRGECLFAKKIPLSAGRVILSGLIRLLGTLHLYSLFKKALSHLKLLGGPKTYTISLTGT
jgi:hypothetical protein